MPLLLGVVEDMVCVWLLEFDGEINAVLSDCDGDLSGLFMETDGTNETSILGELALPEEEFEVKAAAETAVDTVI